MIQSSNITNYAISILLYYIGIKSQTTGAGYIYRPIYHKLRTIMRSQDLSQKLKLFGYYFNTKVQLRQITDTQ